MLSKIIDAFDNLDITDEVKPKVGVVGEILVKGRVAKKIRKSTR